MAGLRNKDKECLKGLEKWEIMVLMETWVEEKEWKKLKERLPREYDWGMQLTKRRSKRRRVRGEIIMGIRKDLVEEGTVIEEKEERIMIGRVKRGEERWRVVGVYIWENLDWTLEKIGRWTEEKNIGIKTLMGGILMQGQEEREKG